MSSFEGSTNIQDYTTSQLLQFIGIYDDNISKERIITNSDNMAKELPKVANFFYDIKNALLNLVEQQESGSTIIAPANQEQQSNWYDNEALKQDNEVQNDKLTERKQKIDVFGNQYVPMKKQQLGVNNSFLLPVAQDVLNPNLRTSTQRLVILDSEFREPDTNDKDTSATNYTCNLSDTIYRAYSMRLFSFYIPYTWYVIDKQYGNTCFWIIDDRAIVNITISPGNYTSSEFVTTIIEALLTAGFTFDVSLNAVTYNSNTGKLTLNLYGGIFSGLDINGETINFTISETTLIVFFDFSGTIDCVTKCVNKARTLNQTLGWIMGYRLPFINVKIDGNEAAAVLNLNGTKYLLLSIDDFNKNQVNHNIVTITQMDRKFKLPSYYTPNMPYTCTSPNNLNTGLTTLIEDDTEENGLLFASKYENDYTKTQIVLPSAPRVLTQSQIYTINEINKINNNNTDYLSMAPTSGNVLAMLPVKTNGLSIGSPIIEFSGSLQDNIRNYFGPVNIKRLKVTLYDDKGNVLNLNGGNWNVQLIFDCLYQY